MEWNVDDMGRGRVGSASGKMETANETLPGDMHYEQCPDVHLISDSGCVQAKLP